jgi:hypothetical protein
MRYPMADGERNFRGNGIFSVVFFITAYRIR